MLDTLESMKRAELDDLVKLAKHIEAIKKKRKGPYHANLLEDLQPIEPQISAMIAKIFGYRHNHCSPVFEDFANRFLEPLGFEADYIDTPTITAEENHIDILVQESHKYAVIFENKVNGADFQPNQLARYIATMRKSYNADQIFIVVLPRSNPDTCADAIVDSVWRLPKDWQRANAERQCRSAYGNLCLCDEPSDTPRTLCDSCIDFREAYASRSCFLQNDFAEWLLDAIRFIPIQERVLIASMIIVADYLKTLYGLNIDNNTLMDIEKYLRENVIPEGADNLQSWLAIDQLIKQLESFKYDAEQILKKISPSLIDQWYQNVMKTHPVFEEYKSGKSFAHEITPGIFLGCFLEYVKPYWGFRTTEKATQEQKRLVKDIIDLANQNGAGIYTSKSEAYFPAWFYTTHGDERVIQLLEAAKQICNK